MKQTAVEWLWEQIENKQPNLNWYKIFEQAKEMEKKQMCQFAFDFNDEFINNRKVPTIEQYYNETFKTK